MRLYNFLNESPFGIYKQDKNILSNILKQLYSKKQKKFVFNKKEGFIYNELESYIKLRMVEYDDSYAYQIFISQDCMSAINKCEKTEVINQIQNKFNVVSYVRGNGDTHMITFIF